MNALYNNEYFTHGIPKNAEVDCERDWETKKVYTFKNHVGTKIPAVYVRVLNNGDCQAIYEPTCKVYTWPKKHSQEAFSWARERAMHLREVGG